MRGLTGKVAIVAGGATGIGRSTALRLGEEGAQVVVGDINGPEAKAVAGEITAAGGQAIGVHFDISKDDDVARLVRSAVETYGGLDCMHANAADLSIVIRDTDAVAVPLEVFDRTIEVNLRGHLLCTRHAIPELLKRGGGSIIYTSSAAAFFGEPERVSYAIGKSGLLALMRHVASRWGKEGIRANAIAPGWIVTETTRDVIPEEMKAAALAGTRSWRIGETEDIAAMVAFLASDDGAWINGQTLSVDGGATIR